MDLARAKTEASIRLYIYKKAIKFELTTMALLWIYKSQFYELRIIGLCASDELQWQI